MKRYHDLDSILSELREISGISHCRHEEDIEDKWHRILMSEQEMETAEQETALGQARTLAKRMEGVADFIEKKNGKSAAIALAKIIDDAKEFLNELGGGEKEQKTPSEKPKESQKKTGKDNFEKEKDKQGGTSKEKEAARADDGQAPQQGEKPADKKEEIMVNGEIIHDADGRDPFGFGESFIAEVIDIARNGKI